MRVCCSIAGGVVMGLGLTAVLFAALMYIGTEDPVF